MAVPQYDKLFQPLLTAIQGLGGSATITEQEEVVAQNLKLSETDIAELHKGNRTLFSYRLAWARTYLKAYGLLDNSQRGVWVLTPKGLATKAIDPVAVKRAARSVNTTKSGEESESSSEVDDVMSWQDKLLATIRDIEPNAFERLCQRVLRESGFVHVEVTGRSGDGGIDGKGVVRLGGILSFHVSFQCKRYKGSVSSAVIRDFRGAMMGRADKGLIMTTGSFTRDARLEAQRDGATPIDLIDGPTLVTMLKDLRIGVSIKQKIVEEVVIDETYLKQI